MHGAGRTDAGVHALAQVAHLDLPRAAAPDTIRSALNHHVKPAAVAVLAVEPAPDNFDARRSARGRVYRYRILNRRPPPALERGRVWHVGPPLDAEAMQAAAQLLIGRHDFSTFRDSLCQAQSPVQDARCARGDARWARRSRSRRARARSCITRCATWSGTLKLVGAGKWRVERCRRRARGARPPRRRPDRAGRGALSRRRCSTPAREVSRGSASPATAPSQHDVEQHQRGGGKRARSRRDPGDVPLVASSRR